MPFRKSSSSSFWLEKVLISVATMLLGYWGIFALLAPVTVWDSQTYNLARLLIARKAGFFSNPFWTSERQVMFPWSFDAIHLPLVSIGWGYSLPSFLCLLGIAWMSFHVVAHFASRLTGWFAVVSLCSLPTVIYQATSTKNDLGLVFVAGFAAFSLFRFHDEPGNTGWLWLNALAVGFLPGIKNTGLPLAAIFGIYVIIQLRCEPRRAARWIGVAATSFLLLGSSEILLNNQLTYQHPLGLESVVKAHSNRDGLAGATANLIRYVFGLLNPGLAPADPSPGWATHLEYTCRNLLMQLNLTDQGIRNDFPDKSLRFYKMGWEAASDFGPLGTLAMLVSTIRLAYIRRRDAAWWCAATAWGLILLTSITIAWMPWNNRFLMLPVILFVLATALVIQRAITANRWVASTVLGFLLYGAVVYPLFSFNKQPADLANALFDRESTMLKERSSMREVLDAVHDRDLVEPGATWLLHAGSDSWVFCLLDLPSPRFQLIPVISPEEIKRRLQSEQRPVYLLVLNRSWIPPPNAALVKQFQWESDSALYRLEP